MLTSRGWWLLLISLFVTAMGVARSADRGPLLVILGLTTLAWITIEWCRFLIALRGGLPRVRIERELRDDRGPVATLWAGHSFTVTIRVTCDSRLPMPVALMDDRFPFGAELVQGGTNAAGVLRRGQTIEIRYRIRCKAPGPIRFEGVRLRFTDPQALLYHETFIRQPLVYPALPMLVDG